ncbi:MAG TPA: EAL domain-containing protein [Solirubrobacteraceae bacterium]|nr:EAL domain-containing protein [Solirubrobacteraceae bacterium]
MRGRLPPTGRFALSPRRSPPARHLRAALSEDQLEVHYQPKLRIDAERVAGVEALVRWRHPQRGLLAPGDFLLGLEHHEVLGDLAVYVLDVALAQATAWRREGAPLTVAVNVASASLIDESWPASVGAALERWEVPSEALVLEITETAILQDPDRAAAVLRDLVATGVTVSLDDFGTGESSLSRLLQFPIAELKIDRSFLRHVAVRRSRGLKVVKAVVDLAHELGQRVVAEGVEDRPTLDLLADMRCDEAQGYYICRPVPAADLPHWARNPPAAADRLFMRRLGTGGESGLGGAFRSPAVASAWP